MSSLTGGCRRTYVFLIASLLALGSRVFAQEAPPNADAQHPPHEGGTSHKDQAQHDHDTHSDHEGDHDHAHMQHGDAPDHPQARSDDGSSEAEHVAPEPPQHEPPPMPYKAMAQMMQMDDTERVGQVLLDQFEWRHSGDNDAAVWEAQGWYGGDYNKLWVKTEGERVRGSTEDARVDVLWDRIVSRWWSLQAGARHDFGEGPSRTWGAIGLEGLAPYWFDVEATFYVGEQGRTAARLKAEYDLLLTQRLILQPEAEANLYGKSDPERLIGSGLSDLDVGIRLRYEIRREFAPYIGVTWRRRFGSAADFVRAAGASDDELQFVAGLRVWF